MHPHAPLVLAAMFAVVESSRLTLAGENSEIVLGSATLKASCTSAEEVSVVTLSCARTLGELDAMNASACDDGAYTDLSFIARAHLRNVALTCMGKAAEEPCAASPLFPTRRKLFTCSWSPAGASDVDVLTSGPYHAAVRLEKLDGVLLGGEAYVDCAPPDLMQAISAWPLGGEHWKRGGAAPPTLNLTLSVTHMGGTLAWRGHTGGNAILLQPPWPPPPSPPPPPPPPPLPPPPSPPPPDGVRASGGIEKMITVNGIQYKRHVFTSSATFTVTSPGELKDLLLVGGGGGCGFSKYHNGGGGAGGLIHAQGFVVTEGTYAVVVGVGGQGGGSYSQQPSNGKDTTLFGLVAMGGGGTGWYNDCAGGTKPSDGGSGGGGSASCNAFASNNPYFQGGQSKQNKYADRAKVQGFGNAGGLGAGPYPHISGGGGGAGGPGQAGGRSTAQRHSTAAGGLGMDFSHAFGNDVGDDGWFASGGAGGPYDSANSNANNPRKGGGGKYSNGQGTSGQPNTGGGCGGSERAVSKAGESGGSGVVILIYEIG